MYLSLTLSLALSLSFSQCFSLSLSLSLSLSRPNSFSIHSTHSISSFTSALSTFFITSPLFLFSCPGDRGLPLSDRSTCVLHRACDHCALCVLGLWAVPTAVQLALVQKGDIISQKVHNGKSQLTGCLAGPFNFVCVCVSVYACVCASSQSVQEFSHVCSSSSNPSSRWKSNTVSSLPHPPNPHPHPTTTVPSHRHLAPSALQGPASLPQQQTTKAFI